MEIAGCGAGWLAVREPLLTRDSSANIEDIRVQWITNGGPISIVHST